MARGKMSAEAKAKIATAQRKRWAAHRAAKAGGSVTTGAKRRGRPPGSTTGKRRGRPPKGASTHNPFMNMTIHALVAARRNVEEAWNATLAMLGMGGTTKAKGRRGRPKKKK